MTQEFKGFVWGFSIHSARSSQCGTRKRGERGSRAREEVTWPQLVQK